MKNIQLPIIDIGILNSTVETERSRLTSALNSKGTTPGIRCNCCGGTVGVYRRSLYRGIVLPLIELRKRELAGERGVRSADINGVRDYDKARFWDLIEKRDKQWALTPKGRAFVDGDIAVPKSVFVFNATMVGIPNDVKMVTIKEVHSETFDKNEIFDNGERAA